MTPHEMTGTAHRAPDRPLLPRATWLPWVVATIAGAIAIALSIWAVNLRNDRDAIENRLAVALQENAEIRRRANATRYELSPTAQGPENASGVAFFSLSGSGVLTVANMPLPDDGQVYQLWYLAGDMHAPVPGGTFTVDAQGVGFTLIPADAGEFRAIGVSLEPGGGSTVPTGPILLSSEVPGARG